MKIVCTIKSIQSSGNGKAVATIVPDPVFGEGQFMAVIEEANVKGGQIYSIDGEGVQMGDGLTVDISKFQNPDA